MDTLRFKYKIPLVTALSPVVVIFMTAAGLGYLAFSNASGLRIGGIFAFSPEGATILWWAMTAVATLVAPMTIWFLIRSLIRRPSLVLGPSSAILPNASLGGKLIYIPYAAVESIKLAKVGGHEFLFLRSNIGNSTLLLSGFANRKECAQFVNTLRSRTGIYCAQQANN